MSKQDNKIKYNIKNVHYAKLTVDVDGAATYAKPVHIPGAVGLSMSAEGGTTPFYADGTKYHVTVANNGYSGDLEVALIPDAFRVEILSETLDTTAKIYTENAYSNPNPCAFLFEFDGDQHSVRHVLYNCTVTRPGLNGTTTTESKDPQTDSLSISAIALQGGLIKAKTGVDTPPEVYDKWYDAVWQPAIAAGGVGDD